MIRSTSVILLLVSSFYTVRAWCTVPEQFQGDFFSMEFGDDVDTIITNSSFINKYLSGTCASLLPVKNQEYYVVFYSIEGGCYQCFLLLARSPNVVQYKKSECLTYSSPPSADQACSSIHHDSEIDTFFRKTVVDVNCKITFYGVYRMRYRLDVGWGFYCKSPDSYIVACQLPGSPYTDNTIFSMNFAVCQELTFTTDRRFNGRKVFQCLGTWHDVEGGTWSAVAELKSEVLRERFRCIYTRLDAESSDFNTFYYTMSLWADCKFMVGIDQARIKMDVWPAIGDFQDSYLNTDCHFPANYTGTYFYQNEYMADVKITTDHIYIKNHLSEYKFEEKYFACRMNVGTRFLTTAVTVGRCEVDYVCWDMLPRHQNIIRWRMGKPFRASPLDLALDDFEHVMFRRACSWSAFTIDRNDALWKYHMFILNPPTPIKCPIRGRYRFEQFGEDSALFKTRIRGITARPRHSIDCYKYVSELKSCTDNPFIIKIDAEYCETVDHNGKPISEYDVADWNLACVGYWSEDMQMYLITWDKEDDVSEFRCWNYDRIDFRHIQMSRSNTANCMLNMKPTSHTAEEGASLMLLLEDSERLFDECPQVQMDFQRMFMNYGSASCHHLHVFCVIFLIISLAVETLKVLLHLNF